MAEGNRTGRPARILFAIHCPWEETYGLSQVFMALMREFQRMGYHCEKYSVDDAFPLGFGRFSRYFGIALFQRKLLRYIRQNGHRFDVIHTDHMLIPFPRSRYRFSGCLVVKAQGLIHFFEKFFRQKTDGSSGTLFGNVMRRIGWWARGGLGSANRAFDAADQIHMLNTDELAFVRDELGYGSKVVLVPNGLTEDQTGALAASSSGERRASSNAVVFVGVWSARKGNAEFPEIIREVRRQRPATRFRMIGTWFDEERVLGNLAPQDRDSVEVIPRFERGKLPALLADARVGVFPSHMEGFPLGVLEMLSAGIPVVAWDVPGPRDMINLIPNLSMTPAGSTAETATEVLRLLECNEEEYVTLSAACVKATERFTWEQVARQIEDLIPALGIEKAPASSS